MKLTILGCYAATPRTMTNPTSQVLEIKNHMFLIDCGEGTQVQLRKHKIRFSKINHIFISHLHGDHFFGLPGLVSTFRLLGRDSEMHIYGPKGIEEAINLLLRLGNSWTNYKLIFHELTSKESELIYEDDKVTVKTIPLSHRVYTNGFLFEEKLASRTLDVEAAQRYQIETCYFQNIKNGRDITLDDGRVIPNDELTFDPPKPKSYAFCSDTAYKPDIVPLIKNVDVLYHEATFLETQAELAPKTKHSTAKEAASIAKQANVGQLILGHYSTRYKSIDLFKEEASEIFDAVSLADDGKVFNF
ncbi:MULTISPECIES: ribonuclease Z [Cellulophaga]|jgi:ribonuclease Z|uniref:Ribonuclease Z n=1 Tax=Cellulophaga baltica 18 TaxID=1348584 RepID=A0AAU8RFC6_9FLAO|nr:MULTISPECIES: ribonuclease Z [Cellulophaga]AIZ42155.1 ribonuclease Z [Cellulophaga baltica 18]KGK28988.1 ribonuclease Z [Cellulophaga sp. E6(2014)]WFO17442.1 ribonuclease Z [Cellulophaga baltica 4]